jgi:hypothetical protein
MRDHTVDGLEDVATLLELLDEGAASTTLPYSHEWLGNVAGEIRGALANESPRDRDHLLDLALQQADGAIANTVQGYELRAFGVPGVSAAFAREVLVDDPLLGADPIPEEDLEELLAFKDSPATEDGPGRVQAMKLSQFGRVLYYLHRSITPEGIRMMFGEKLDWLGGKTPREVIDTGTAEENKALLDHAAGLLGTTAS